MNKKNLKFIYKVIYYSLIAIVVSVSGLTLLSVLGIPKNAQIYVVETGSMEPSIQTGSVAFVSTQDTYSVGDVITYKSNLGKVQPKDINVTHRIVEITEDGGDIFYTTKGDNNEANDPWLANKLDVVGKVNNHLPYLGYIIGFAKTKIGFVALILTPAIIVIMLEVMNIIKVFKKPMEDKYNQRILKPKLYFDL